MPSWLKECGRPCLLEVPLSMQIAAGGAKPDTSLHISASPQSARQAVSPGCKRRCRSACSKYRRSEHSRTDLILHDLPGLMQQGVCLQQGLCRVHLKVLCHSVKVIKPAVGWQQSYDQLLPEAGHPAAVVHSGSLYRRRS